MTKRRGIAWFCLFLLAVLLWTTFSGAPQSPDAERSDSLRIVSTAPSITETLFALDLGDCVVGVSNYCKYPEAAKKLPKIGSLYDYNVERIVELNPDFVVVIRENEVLPPQLEKMGIECVAVDHASLDGALRSFEELGARAEKGVEVGGRRIARVGAKAKGAELRREAEARVDAVREKVAGLPKPRTLVSIYRPLGTGKVGEAYVAGQNPYFNTILDIVGAVNVAGDLVGAAPTVNAESIVALNPEVVLDLSTDGVERDEKEREKVGAERAADWDALGNEVEAVRTGRIYQIFDDYATIPGPRAPLFIEELATLLHPELKEGKARD